MHPWTEFWAKARPDEREVHATHPFLAHALDVAAVAVLLPQAPHRPIPRQTLGFLVALHDLGKLSRSFQAMAPAHWPHGALGPMAGNEASGLRHDALGFRLLQEELSSRLDTVLPPRQRLVRGWPHGDRVHLLQALAGHHGRPVEPLRAVVLRDLDAGCVAAAGAFVDAMAALFRPEPLPWRPDVAQLGWDLAGVVTLADWVGSRREWFPYVGDAGPADPAAYWWDHALPRAAAALAAAGLSGTNPARFQGVQDLFPAITLPSPVQDWATTVALPPGPVIAVIEDATGSGKTEAALILAHRLLASGQARGLFMALPTMATANAMFGRMADAYHRLFHPESRPSLVLAHGRATLDPRFRAVMTGRPGRHRGRTQADIDPADIDGEAECASWLAEDRRRALLAECGVGTIDQALLAVLPVRHAALRLQGLKGKVLIVDEVHAFDPYMHREFQELLRFHAALGGSVILLSATLTLAGRNKLVAAFRDGLGANAPSLSGTHYPLATLASATDAAEAACGMRAGLARTVQVTRLADDAAALARILAAARAGAAVAWVRNTVDDAIAAAAAVRAAGLEPLLFHARFAMTDRLDIEAEVLRRFGRTGGSTGGSAGGSPGGNHGHTKGRPGVLIATQVIEQSLDLDFDLLCTDMAPMDLLIQRAGRLCRHQRGPRPVPGPELLVVCPEPVDDPAPGWIRDPMPGTAAVYRDPALLWRTARTLFAAGVLATPGDVRRLIETAADRDAPGAVPPGLAAQAAQAEGQGLAATGVARMNVLDLRAGYARGAGGWDPDTRTPTRLQDQPQTTLRLALLRDGAIVPYAADPDPLRAWSLSEVTVAASRVAACKVPAGLEQAAAVARAQWGRWERDSPHIALAVMTVDEGVFTLRAWTERFGEATVRYDPAAGLLAGRSGVG